MVSLERSIVVNRPIDEVFAYIADPCRDPHWNDPILAARILSAGPFGVGTRFEYQAEFLGRRMEMAGEVIAYELNRRVCVRTTGGPLESSGCRSVETIPGGTRLTVTIEGRAGGLFRLAEGIAARAARHQLDESLTKLKGLLEANGTA